MAEIYPHVNEHPPAYPDSESDPNPHATIRSTPSILSESSLAASNVTSQGREMKRKFNSLRSRLQEKEESMMAMLESNANIGEMEKIQQLQQLYDSKNSLKESMKNPMLDSGLQGAIETIQDQINKLEKQLNITKYFVWNLVECEASISKVCMLVEHGSLINSYISKKRLRWHSVSNGSMRTQVLNPSGMAVQPYTDHIFIGDPGNQRIQTYNSQGKHLSSLRLEKNFHILHLEFFGDSLFLLGRVEREFQLVKLNPANDQVFQGTLSNLDHIEFNEQDEPTSNFVFSLNKSIHSIQISIYLPNHLILTQAFSFEACEPIKSGGVDVIHLKSPYIEDSTEAVRLKAVGDSLDDTLYHVLYQNSPFALQTFNLRGDLSRAIITTNVMTPSARLSQFILDKDGNVIVCKVRHVTKLNKSTDLIELVDVIYTFDVFSDSGNREHKWAYKSSKSAAKAWIPKRFQKSPGPAFPKLPLAEDHDSHQLFASLNSNQDIIVLHSAEPSLLLRAF